MKLLVQLILNPNYPTRSLLVGNRFNRSYLYIEKKREEAEQGELNSKMNLRSCEVGCGRNNRTTTILLADRLKRP